MLNAGHRNGATVPRCLAGGEKTVDFRVFCPKALAGIGTLPDTIVDRSLPVRLKRRNKDEKVDRFHYRVASTLGKELEDRVTAWVEVNGESLVGVYPDLPDELSDRMQDGCEALAVIADKLGCGQELRNALVALLTAERADNVESVRLRLLRDLHDLFEARNMPANMTTAAILAGLYTAEEGPWLSYHGRSFDARDLATLLGHYGINSTTVRPAGRRNGAARPAKGYKRDDLYEAWERYL
jgi:hypothetical protein